MTLLSSTAALVSSGTGAERRQFGRWHDAGSLVCWASVTKLFTAALVRALVADGELDWSTPVSEVTGRPAPPSVTVGSLVDHTSGLPRVLPSQARAVGDPYAGWTADRVDREVLPELGRLVEEAGRPDGDVEYSNLGYAVLTRVVELRTGRPWIELLRERVVTPLGVAAEAVTVDPAGRPVVLSRSLLGRPQPDWDVSTGPFSGAGGLYTTLPDMLTLLRSAVGGTSELDPRRSPHAWDGRAPRYFHQGAHMRSGSVVIVDIDTGSVAVAHAVGGLPGRGAQHAERALTALLTSTAESARAASDDAG